jgi:hypothetical protein
VSTQLEEIAPSPATPRRARRVLLAVTAGIVVAGLVAGAVTWQVKRHNADLAAEAAARAARNLGPDGFGKLKLGMTQAQALATGDLRAAPVSGASRCQAHSFRDGPKPDPAAIAADVKAEQRAAAAKKHADEVQAKVGRLPGPSASAEEYADYAARAAAATHAISDEINASADSAERILAHARAFLAAGGASFSRGKLRVIAGPAGARTPGGIGRGSTRAQLKSVYGAKGLKSDGADRFTLAIPHHSGWVWAFEFSGDKIADILLEDPTAPCP